MTLKQQLIQEIEQASEERLAELLRLWQSTRKPTPHHAKFMRFAGIAQQQAELMQQIEQDIESNRQLDLDHP
jgi:hypothetical protein